MERRAGLLARIRQALDPTPTRRGVGGGQFAIRAGWVAVTGFVYWRWVASAVQGLLGVLFCAGFWTLWVWLSAVPAMGEDDHTPDDYTSGWQILAIVVISLISIAIAIASAGVAASSPGGPIQLP